MVLLLNILLLVSHLLLLKLQLVLILLVWNLNWDYLSFLLDSSATWIVLFVLTWLFLLRMCSLRLSHTLAALILNLNFLTIFFVTFLLTSHNFFFISFINILSPILMTSFLLEFIILIWKMLCGLRIALAYLLNIRLFQINFCILIWINFMMWFLNLVNSRNL